MSNSQKIALSGLDWQILQTMQTNARITVSEVAQQLNRSRSGVAERHVLTGSDLLMMRVVARDMPHLRELAVTPQLRRVLQP
ncbi:MAG: DNA-binding Lrp family transcriptional regulator [Dinoroseobacter sp.]